MIFVSCIIKGILLNENLSHKGWCWDPNYLPGDFKKARKFDERQTERLWISNFDFRQLDARCFTYSLAHREKKLVIWKKWNYELQHFMCMFKTKPKRFVRRTASWWWKGTPSMTSTNIGLMMPSLPWQRAKFVLIVYKSLFSSQWNFPRRQKFSFLQGNWMGFRCE